MSKWRFEPMPLEEARRILERGELTLDTQGDRIKAWRLVHRVFANDGWAPPPIRTHYVRCEHCNATGSQHGRACKMCRGKRYFESERLT